MAPHNDRSPSAQQMEEGLFSSSPQTSSPSHKKRRRVIFIVGASLAIVASAAVASFATPKEKEEANTDHERHLNILRDIPSNEVSSEETIDPGVLPETVTPVQLDASVIAQQFSRDEFDGLDKLELVMQGKLHAVSMRYAHNSFSYSNDGTYSGVEVEFCKLDYGRHKEDPSEAPTMYHLYGLSEHCVDHLYKFDLSSLVASARDYDSQAGSVTHSMKPKGFIFGEGRSGATVLSNALAVAHPESTRVVSENPVFSYILNACNDLKIKHATTDCNPLAQKQAFRDVTYLIGRTHDPRETDMYVKFSPEDSEYMPLALDVFPTAKWTFNYRDPDVVLSKNLQKYRDDICRKAKGAPSDAAKAHASKMGEDDFANLSLEEACSAHLAAVRNIAIRESESRGTGRLIDYDRELETVTVLLDEILPSVFGVDTTDALVCARVSEQMAKKTGRRGGSGAWKGVDPDENQSNISSEIKSANVKFFGVKR